MGSPASVTDYYLRPHLRRSSASFLRRSSFLRFQSQGRVLISVPFSWRRRRMRFPRRLLRYPPIARVTGIPSEPTACHSYSQRTDSSSPVFTANLRLITRERRMGFTTSEALNATFGPCVAAQRGLAMDGGVGD